MPIPGVSMSTPTPLPPLLSTREAAEVLGVIPVTIRRYVHAGKLRPVRLPRGGPYRFVRQELEELIERHREAS